MAPDRLLTVTPRQARTVGGNTGVGEYGDDADHQAGKDDIKDDKSHDDSGPSRPPPVAGMLYQQDSGRVDKHDAGLRALRGPF